MAKKEKINQNIAETGTITYSFKEIFTNPDTGEQHFITPHSDPRIYEDSYGYIFNSVEEAGNFLQNDIENETISEDEVQSWFLVKSVNSVLPAIPAKFNTK